MKRDERDNLLDEIIRRAAAVLHSDGAADLVYFINNTVGAKKPAWRSWRCDKHNYAGSGATPECPICKRAAKRRASK